MSEKLTQPLPMKAAKAKRIEEIKRFAETVGLWNVPQGQLAEKLGVTRKTIYNDIQSIFKKGIDKDSLSKAMVNIDNLNKALLVDLQRQYHEAKTPHQKTQIARLLLELQTKITDFLERYGIKEIHSAPVDNQIEIIWGGKKEDEEKDITPKKKEIEAGYDISDSKDTKAEEKD